MGFFLLLHNRGGRHAAFCCRQRKCINGAGSNILHSSHHSLVHNSMYWINKHIYDSIFPLWLCINFWFHRISRCAMHVCKYKSIVRFCKTKKDVQKHGFTLLCPVSGWVVPLVWHNITFRAIIIISLVKRTILNETLAYMCSVYTSIPRTSFRNARKKINRVHTWCTFPISENWFDRFS